MKRILPILLIFICSYSGTGQSINPNFESGKDAIMRGEYYDAMLAFNLVIHSDPSNAAAYHNRAVARIKVNDLPGAIYDLSQAVSLRPAERAHYLERARVYSELAQLSNALQDCNSLIRINPQDYEAYEMRALLFVEMERNREAVEDLSLLLKNKGVADLALAYIVRAETYTKLGEYKKAIADYSSALEKEPDLSTFLARAKLYYEIKDFKKACADYEKAAGLGYSDDRLKRQAGCN